MVTNQFLASFGVFSSFFIIETSQEEGESCEINGNASWSSNTWRIQALEHFIALCQTNQRRKEEVQQPAVSHGCANFAHHAKPLEDAKFRMVCEIFPCTDYVRFLSSDILCNFLVSPCNQPRYFLLYLFIYLLGSIYIRRETEGDTQMDEDSLNTCKFP